jgi:hypothetical protein
MSDADQYRPWNSVHESGGCHDTAPKGGAGQGRGSTASPSTEADAAAAASLSAAHGLGWDELRTGPAALPVGLA